MRLYLAAYNDIVKYVSDKPKYVLTTFVEGEKSCLNMINLVGVDNFILDSDAIPSAVAGQDVAWHSLMGASWRVIVASFLAQLISDLSNTYVYEGVYRKLGNKHIWLRTLVSNLPATLLDSVVFSYVAFLGVLPDAVIFASVISSFAVKYVISILATPMAYLNEKTVKEDK